MVKEIQQKLVNKRDAALNPKPCAQVGIVEALTTIEYEVQLTLGNVRGQTTDKEGAHFFLGGCGGGCIGDSGGRCGGGGVGFKTGQLGE